MEKVAFIVGFIVGLVILLLLLKIDAHHAFTKHPTITLKQYWSDDE